MSESNSRRFTALSEDEEDNVDFMSASSAAGAGGRHKSAVQHPVTCAFHVLFRTLAVLVYFFCNWFTHSFVIAFVLIALLHSMDFWTVKNVTGRLLVGLRWWNEVTESGSSEWFFESRPRNERNLLVSSSESTVFWVALIAAPSIWFFLFLTTLFSMKFAWMMIVLLGLTVTGSNLYGYTRCRLGSKRTLSGAAAQFLGKQVINAGVAEMQQQNSSSKSQNLTNA